MTGRGRRERRREKASSAPPSVAEAPGLGTIMPRRKDKHAATNDTSVAWT